MFSGIDLHKTYRSKGEAVEALRGVTVHFGETGMVFILGKSGSGKSTLLHILGGLDRADSGGLKWTACRRKVFPSGILTTFAIARSGLRFRSTICFPRLPCAITWRSLWNYRKKTLRTI